MAVVAANGGDGHAWVWRGREQRRGRSTGESERSPGGEVGSSRRRAGLGGGRQAGGVAALPCARVGHTPASSWHDGEDDWHCGPVGCTVLGRLGAR